MKKALSISTLILIALILVGAFFRLYYADLTRFEHEMVRDIIFGRQLLEGKIMLHGIFASQYTTAQTSLGPLSYYLAALGILFAPSTYYIPIAPLFIIAILDILAAIVTYKLGKEFFGKNVGIIAAALYLLSPWQIVNVATVITPTNFLPLFAASFFYCTFKFIVQNKEKYIIPAIAFLTLATHLHLTSLLLAPALLIAIIIFKRDVIKIKKPYITLAILVALLIQVPFLYYAINKGEAISPFTHIANRQRAPIIRTIVESLGTPILFMAPYLGDYTLGKGVSIFSHPIADVYFTMLTVLITLFFIAGVVYCIALRKKGKQYLLTLTLFFIPITVYIIKSSNVAPHYFLILLPLQMIMAANFINALLRKWKITAIIILTIIVLSNVVYLFTFYNFVENNGGTKGVYGIPYKNKVQLVEHILEDSNNAPKLVYYQGQKPLIQSINYLVALRTNHEPDYKLIQHIGEFDEGYLIIDRYSFYKAYTDKGVPEEDNPAIDTMSPLKFKQLEVIKKTRKPSSENKQQGNP